MPSRIEIAIMVVPPVLAVALPVTCLVRRARRRRRGRSFFDVIGRAWPK
jgi:cytochrome c oxidase assembly factor CtaG